MSIEQGKTVRETSPRSLFEQIVRDWRASRTPDARRAFAEFPSLRANRSVAMDLIYEEYCIGLEDGQHVDANEFGEKYPEFASSIYKQVEVLSLVRKEPQLLQRLDVRWPTPGEHFGDFAIIDELGRGSFARVYLAEDRSLASRKVVLKLSIGLTDEPEIIARLDHDNIVSVMSVHAPPLSPFSAMCMPFHSRVTLEALLGLAEKNSESVGCDSFERLDLKNGTLRRRSQVSSVDQVGLAISIGRDVAAGLSYAHKNGVSHLDVKPSNILLCSDSRAMLLDFNLASPKQGDTVRGGTISYMSPEQFEFFNGSCEAAPSRESDIFSLGCVLFEIVVGKPFYSADCDRAKEGDEEKRMIELRRACGSNREAFALISECLNGSPEARPSADAMENRCAAYFRPARRALRQLQKRLLTIGIVACVLVSSLILLITFGPIWYHGYLSTRAKVKIRNGQYKAGYELLISIPDDSMTREDWIRRGIAEMQLNKREFATGSFRQAINLKKGKDARILMAYNFGEMAYFEISNSQYFLAKVEASDPEFALVQNNMAYAEIQLGGTSGYERALRYANKALSSSPGYTPARINRLIALVNLSTDTKDVEQATVRANQAWSEAQDLNESYPNQVLTLQLKSFAATAMSLHDPSYRSVSEKLKRSLAEVQPDEASIVLKELERNQHPDVEHFFK